MTPGKKEDKLGMRASDTSEVLFENCRIPADQLLGEEGQGFVNTMQVLDAGRIGIAALSVGLAQGAYEAALALRAGAQGVRQDHQQLSGDSVEAGRQRRRDRGRAAADLSRRATSRISGERTTLESSMAKLYASEIAVQRRRRLRADPRRLRLRQGLSGREVSSATSSSRPSAKARARSSASSSPGSCWHDAAAMPRSGRPRARGRSAGDRARHFARSKTRIRRRPICVRAIFRRTGRAYLIGVTGPPGAGKSTLVDRPRSVENRRAAAARPSA